MQRRKKYFKLVAFVPAIVLAGGFIGCRAGAFQLFSKPDPVPDAVPVAPESQPPDLSSNQPSPDGKPTFMGGSKSAPAFGTTVGLTPAGTHAPDLDVPIKKPQPPTPKP